MSQMLHVIFGILAVVLAFGFIIFIHELGHFLAARAVDIRCPQFAIGFGPQIFGFRWRGTNFAVRALPLGGYVLMDGEEPDRDKADPWVAAVEKYLDGATFPATPDVLLSHLEAVPESERGAFWQEVRDQVAFARTKSFSSRRDVEGNFHDRSIPARVLVISGGVLMNFLATIVLLWLLVPFVGVGAFFSGWDPIVAQVQAGMPAQSEGVHPGARIVKIEGQAILSHVEAFEAIGARAGEPTEITFESEDGTTAKKSMVPDLAYAGERFRIEGKQLHLVASVQHPELVGKLITAPPIDELRSMLKEEGKTAYRLTIEGKVVDFAAPTAPTKLRGQIGVLFGVNGVGFEDRFTNTVAEVVPGLPAYRAGVRAGDHLLMVGGWNGYGLMSVSGQGFGSLLDPALTAYARLGKPFVPLIVLRGEEVKTFDIAPLPHPLTAETLGIALEPLTIGDKLAAPFVMIGSTLKMPYDILKAWLSNRATGTQIVESMSGPVGIMGLIYDLSDNGLLSFIFFMGLLNAAIGAFNVLPFPALDGARLVFLAIAFLRGGRQLDPEKEAKVHMLGLILLLGFVVVVTFGDIKKLFASSFM